jgi:glycosyltransferase involved in cell wall biosynthesis
VRNGAATIGETLLSLATQTIADFEVVVVDDGSTDDTLEVVTESGGPLGERLRVIREQGAGPAAARNAGWEAARADVIAFIDADVEAEPAWLERGLEALRDGPGIAAVEGRTLTPDGRPVPFGYHAMYNPEGGLFMTCNMLYRREALEATGGFDPRYRRAFYEDSDLAFSVMSQGGRITFAPEAVVRHRLIPASTWWLLKDAARFSYAPLLHRRHPRLYARYIAPHLKALNPIHLDYLLALAGLAVALGTREWVMAGVMALLTLWFFGRVRRLHRVPRTDARAMAQALVLPMVRVVSVLAGSVRFGHFSRHI